MSVSVWNAHMNSVLAEARDVRSSETVVVGSCELPGLDFRS